MSGFFKSKGRMIAIMCVAVLAITCVAAGTAMVLMGTELPEFGGGSSSVLEEDSPSAVPEAPDPDDPEAVAAMAALEDAGKEGPELPAGEDLPEEDSPVYYNVPSQMRGVFLVPGVDFMKGGTGSSESAIRSEIDQALSGAAKLTMNAVIIDTTYDTRVIYQTADASKVSADFDIMGYLVEQARAKNLYTYAVFDASPYQQAASPVSSLAVGAGAIDKLTSNLREFAEKYRLDGILIDGYQNREQQGSYVTYLASGGAMGYNNYMRQSPEAIVKSAVQTVRKYARGTQVGLLADAVWANAEEEEGGSNTHASYTALHSANADTRSWVEEGLMDFVAVRAYGSLTDGTEPFKEVASWWADLASANSIPLYLVHASDRICTERTGWEGHDQITKQIIEAESLSAYRGSMFNQLSRLAEDPKEATTTLVKYYNEEVQAAHILTELEITKPEQATFTTFEPVVTFTGASDPNSPVTINGEEIQTDTNGYFTVTIDLEAGANSFTIVHKEKTLNYTITRHVQVLREISPMGSIATEGGMTLTITASAYSDAQVYATINGTTVAMTIDDETISDESERDSDYKLFTGEYTVPPATDSEQSLGNIMVYASWGGISDSEQGASVKVNKKAKIEDGVPVVITAAQATTYPPDTLNNVPDPNYFPLPQGAMDYAVGDEIVYKNGKNTYTYYVLSSGLRVESGDLSTVSDYPSGNAISGMTVTADRSHTYVTLKMSQKVSYTFRYTPQAMSVEFHYTGSVPGGLSLDKNPLFSSAKWNDTTLNLTLIKQGAFVGYRGYYDSNGNLVLRFKNPPSSLSSARIAIDPGHGGGDPGTAGFLAEYPEKVINLAIAKQLREELESRGATVMLLDTSNNPSLPARVQHAENWGADYFVSVHNNSAANSNAVGTEVYYFNSFSYPLALNTSSSVSSKFNTTNRGAKKSHYHVTLSSQFPSMLVECGFMSNRTEYEKLLKTSNQRQIAIGIADGLASTIQTMRTGSTATGEQSVGGSVAAGTESTAATQSEDTGSDAESGLYLNQTALTLSEGETAALTATADSDDQELTWKSGNTSVATVDENGVVTAHKAGMAKITVTTEDGDSAECQVEVLETEEDEQERSSTGGGSLFD